MTRTPYLVAFLTLSAIAVGCGPRSSTTASPGGRSGDAKGKRFDLGVEYVPTVGAKAVGRGVHEWSYRYEKRELGKPPAISTNRHSYELAFSRTLGTVASGELRAALFHFDVATKKAAGREEPLEIAGGDIIGMREPGTGWRFLTPDGARVGAEAVDTISDVLWMEVDREAHEEHVADALAHDHVERPTGTGLIPGRPVAVGERWNPDLLWVATMLGLERFEGVDASTLPPSMTLHATYEHAGATFARISGLLRLPIQRFLGAEFDAPLYVIVDYAVEACIDGSRPDAAGRLELAVIGSGDAAFRGGEYWLGVSRHLSYFQETVSVGATPTSGEPLRATGDRFQSFLAGFSVELPAGWEIRDAATHMEVLAPATAAARRPRLTVRSRLRNDYVSAEKLLDGMLASIESGGAMELVDKELFDLPGHRGLKTTLRRKGATGPDVASYTLVGEHRMVLIVGVSAEADFSTLAPLFDDIARSYRPAREWAGSR